MITFTSVTTARRCHMDLLIGDVQVFQARRPFTSRIWGRSGPLNVVPFETFFPTIVFNVGGKGLNMVEVLSV